MKKTIIILLLITALLLVGCSSKKSSSNNNTTESKTNSMDQPSVTQKQGLLSVDEILESYSKSMLKCDSYSLSKYMKPVWENQVIYNETVMFFMDKNGEIKDKSLLFPIAKVLEVRDNTLETLYEEGKDYTVVDGKLHYVEGSSICLTKYEDYYLDEPNNKDAVFPSIKEEGKYYVYSEGDYFARRQVSVTYIRTTEWNGPEIKRDESKLPKTMKKLENHEPLTIVYYGDSIMTGCNSSGFNKVEPKMPILSKLITKKLMSQFEDSDIVEINTAVGGWTTNNGVISSEIQSRVINQNPDLVVIGFGANDGTFNLDPNTYGANIQTMMKKVLASNPDCEFILISTPIPNRDAASSIGNMAGNCEDYIEVLKSLSEKNNVAFADMTSLSKYVLTIKDWVDITGNNINHPSDFMIRLEAQLVCSLFF